jgi:NTE family protein
METPEHSIGITLSGGGARGIAHIGVLESLRNHGFSPTIVSGSSMGSLIGVLYAAGYEPLDILNLIKSKNLIRLIKWHLPQSGLINLKVVEKILREKIVTDDFSALKRKFYCTVSNLNSGLAEYKSEGELIMWVIASASIPIIFEPVIINNFTYVDGGLLNNLPVAPLRDHCRFLIGVYVDRNDELKEIRGFKNIAERVFRLGIQQNANPSMKLCDLLIEPEGCRDFSTFDFRKADEIFRAGYEETEKVLQDQSIVSKIKELNQEFKSF